MKYLNNDEFTFSSEDLFTIFTNADTFLLKIDDDEFRVYSSFRPKPFEVLAWLLTSFFWIKEKFQK